jgi:type II secretory pathway component PulK
MNAIKGICWALVLSALLWIAMFAAGPAIIHEVEWRQERVQKRAKVNQWLCERALNEHRVRQEWTR